METVGLASSTDIKVSFEPETRARFLNSPHSGRRSEMSKKWRCGFCLSEDRDSAGEPLKDVVAEIVGVLTLSEEDEAPRSR